MAGPGPDRAPVLMLHHGAQQNSKDRPPVGSTHQLRQPFFVKPDKEGRALPYGRRAELSRPPQQELEQLIIGGASITQVNLHKPLPLGHPELGNPIQNDQGVLALQRILGSTPNLPVLHTILRKKLLRAFTTRSARPVIPPIKRGSQNYSVRKKVNALRATAAPHQAGLPGDVSPGSSG